MFCALSSPDFLSDNIYAICVKRATFMPIDAGRNQLPPTPLPPASSPRTIENRCNECNDKKRGNRLLLCRGGTGHPLGNSMRLLSFFFFSSSLDASTSRGCSPSRVYILWNRREEELRMYPPRVLDRRSSRPLLRISPLSREIFPRPKGVASREGVKTKVRGMQTSLNYQC